jgi:hypothetical protein
MAIVFLGTLADVKPAISQNLYEPTKDSVDFSFDDESRLNLASEREIMNYVLGEVRTRLLKAGWLVTVDLERNSLSVEINEDSAQVIIGDDGTTSVANEFNAVVDDLVEMLEGRELVTSAMAFPKDYDFSFLESEASIPNQLEQTKSKSSERRGYLYYFLTDLHATPVESPTWSDAWRQ